MTISDYDILDLVQCTVRDLRPSDAPELDIWLDGNKIRIADKHVRVDHILAHKNNPKGFLELIRNKL